MCGIAGIAARREVSLEALAGMTRALAHRGPDDEGYLLLDADDKLHVAREPRQLPSPMAVGGTVALGHRRLAIIDLDPRSAQPMLAPGGRLAITFNGELYNYLELRAELEGAGRSFATTGDTEVLLQAWEAWGPACVDRFVGMWSLALLDLDRRTLVLSRDRFGIKPLYFSTGPWGTHFASELKALLADDGVPTEPCEESVAEFLATGRTASVGRTFFEGIAEVRIGAFRRTGMTSRAPRPRSDSERS
jgi:asparagine synthase (glutamine-hydrolysing)